MKFNTVLVSTAMLLICLATGAHSQETQSAKDTAESVPTLTLREISKEAVETSNLLRLVGDRMANVTDLSALQSRIDDAEDVYRRDIEIYRIFRQGTPNRQKLESETSTWYIARDKRDNWQNAVQEVLSTAQTSQDQLLDKLQLWQRTLSSVEARQIPESTERTIRQNISLIREELDNIETTSNKAVDLSIRISDQTIEISDIIDDLQKWRHSGEINVFYKRHDAIWNTDFGDRAGKPDESSWYTIRDKFDGLLLYMRDFKGHVIKYLIIVLLTGIILYLMRYRIRTKDDWLENELEKQRYIVTERTNATIIFIAIFVANLYLHSVPDFLLQLILLVFVFNAHYVLQPFILPRYKNVILFLAIVFILNDAKTYLWFTSPNYRLYLYLETLVGFAIAARYILPYVRLHSMNRTRLNVAVIISCYLLIALYITAFIANTLGYTNLADLALRISVRGSIITVMAVGFIFVLGGVLQVAFTLAMAEHEKYSHEVIVRTREKVQNVVFWLASVYWILLILNLAEILGPVSRALNLWLTEPWVIQDFTLTPGSIVSIIITIVVAMIITKVIAVVIESGFIGYVQADQGLLNIISMVLRYVVVVYALAIALRAVGLDLTKFGLMAGALGVGIGFGLQNIVASFIAGMVLVFERPMVPGDTIEVDGTFGVVQRISVRSTKIKTYGGADITIPNNDLLANKLINWTEDDAYRRIEINIGVAYGTDTAQVQQILLETASQNIKVLTTPPPVAFFDQFGSSSIDFRLLFWVHIDDGLTARSEVSAALYDRLAKEGIEIPFPQQDIHLKNA